MKDTSSYLMGVIHSKKSLCMHLITNSQEMAEAECNGADILGIFHTACLKIPFAAGYLPIADANRVVWEAGQQIDLKKSRLPVFAGICGSEPIRLMGTFLRELRSTGFSGVINFPPMSILNGSFRRNLDALNFSSQREIRMLELAHNNADLVPFALVSNPNEAIAAISVGVKIIVYHIGFSSFLSRDSKTVNHMLEQVRKFTDQLRCSGSNVKILVYAGEEAFYKKLTPQIAEKTDADGLFCVYEPSGRRDRP